MGNGIMDLIILFISHFLFDFVFQSREMGKKKSEDINYLLKHGGILFMGYMWAAYAICDRWEDMLIMSGIIVLIHCIQDWYIWRGYKTFTKWRWREHNESEYHMDLYMKTKFKYWEDPKFYATIGLDQTLHFITIVLVYNWVL